MKNFLFPQIKWNKVRYVGFDLDGVLYDEFEFIEQAYDQVTNLFNNKTLVKRYMLGRWLEKGSSFNKIFQETYELYYKNLISKIDKETFIENCLLIFRNFNPKLKLSPRTEYILNYFSKHYKIFLVSDGNLGLQKKKFNSLKLYRYFDVEHVFFTGCDSLKYSKPNIDCLNELKIIPFESVYFGDREIDKLFAKYSRMQFQKVYNMIRIC